MKKLIPAFLALASFALPAAAQTITGTYSAFWLGLPVGTVTISHGAAPGERGEAYAFSMTLQSGGILGSSRFTTAFSAQGLAGQGTLAPALGHFADLRRGVQRTETIRFGSDLPQFTSVPQYIVPAEFQFDLSRTRGALDPSSGLFMLLKAAAADNCERRFRIYDGFSLYQATIRDAGISQVRTRQYRGPARKCRLSLEPIAGKAEVFGTLSIPEMEVMVASLADGAPALPVRGALIVNGQRAGLRLDAFHVR